MIAQKERTAPQHTRSFCRRFTPTKSFACTAWAVFFFSGNLSGQSPSILLRKTVPLLKSPTGAFIAPLRLQTRACRVAGGAGSHLRQRKTERSRWGTPCLTYRVWIFAGCVFRGAPCFCFAFNFLTHGFRPPACMICYRLVAGSVIFRFLPMQAWQGSHRGGWW